MWLTELMTMIFNLKSRIEQLENEIKLLKVDKDGN